MQEKVRCAIVGLGRIGSMLEDDRLREKPCTHAGAVASDGDCVLVGGCDPDGERCRRFAERWNCPGVYADLGDLLEATKPDIVHIATPPETHLALVESVLGSSARVIICEKPLALTGDEAALIAHYHQRGTLIIMTNHERRYSLDYLRVKQHVEVGTFGDLLCVSAKIYMGMRRSPIEMLLDDGTHLIDIVRFLTGYELERPDAVRVVTAQSEMLYIRCSAGGIPVHMDIGSGRDHIVFELDLSFSSGRIRIGNGLYEEYRSEESPFYEQHRSLVSMGAKRLRKTGYFTNMLRDAVRCVRDPQALPRSTAVDGYRAVHFIDQVRDLMCEGARESCSASSRTLSRNAGGGFRYHY